MGDWNYPVTKICTFVPEDKLYFSKNLDEGVPKYCITVRFSSDVSGNCTRNAYLGETTTESGHNYDKNL